MKRGQSPRFGAAQWTKTGWLPGLAAKIAPLVGGKTALPFDHQPR
jgi:hypothetical protein